MVSLAIGLPSSAYSPGSGLEGAHWPKPHMHHACAGALTTTTTNKNAPARTQRQTRFISFLQPLPSRRAVSPKSHSRANGEVTKTIYSRLSSGRQSNSQPPKPRAGCFKRPRPPLRVLRRKSCRRGRHIPKTCRRRWGLVDISGGIGPAACGRASPDPNYPRVVCHGGTAARVYVRRVSRV
jgi:hypothetical protein